MLYYIFSIFYRKRVRKTVSWLLYLLQPIHWAKKNTSGHYVCGWNECTLLSCTILLALVQLTNSLKRPILDPTFSKYTDEKDSYIYYNTYEKYAPMTKRNQIQLFLSNNPEYILAFTRFSQGDKQILLRWVFCTKRCWKIVLQL